MVLYKSGLLKLSLLLVGCGLLCAVRAEPPAVVVTIKPIHSLVVGVMQGVAEPVLLLQGAASPHTYSLRPSAVRTIQRSTVIFQVSAAFETFLSKALASTADIRRVELAYAPGVELLPLRAGGVWGAHEHVHEDQHQAEAEQHYNLHIWLDPQNAIAMARHIGDLLSVVDPDNKNAYQTNATALVARLQALQQELRKTLQTVKEKPYIVFHDAYLYFEQRFGLRAVGALTLTPELPPGAKRVREIRNIIAETHARCVFSEPQFAPALVNIVIEGSAAKHAVLDPLGVELSAGSEAYFQLLSNLAQALRDCLTS